MGPAELHRAAEAGGTRPLRPYVPRFILRCEWGTPRDWSISCGTESSISPPRMLSRWRSTTISTWRFRAMVFDRGVATGAREGWRPASRGAQQRSQAGSVASGRASPEARPRRDHQSHVNGQQPELERYDLPGGSGRADPGPLAVDGHHVHPHQYSGSQRHTDPDHELGLGVARLYRNVRGRLSHRRQRQRQTTRITPPGEHPPPTC